MLGRRAFLGAFLAATARCGFGLRLPVVEEVVVPTWEQLVAEELAGYYADMKRMQERFIELAAAASLTTARSRETSSPSL